MAESKTRKEKYAEYRKTEQWLVLRDFARFVNKRKNDGRYKCEYCGRIRGKEFHVHHETYPSDLKYDSPIFHVLICKPCHDLAHAKIEHSEKVRAIQDGYHCENMMDVCDAFVKKGK